MNAETFYREAQTFLEQLFLRLSGQNVTFERHWQIDHLCYRASSLQSYESFKKSFEGFADLLIESDVNGRPIATYKLSKPVHFKDWSIDVVELPAPKPGKVTIEGFEHLEVVSDLTFVELKSRYPQCEFNESGLKKDFNQELEINLAPLALKFHPLSLESVIRLEKNAEIHKAIKESQILKLFSAYEPRIVGTFPLDLAVSGSDVDVLLYADDLDSLQKEFQQHLGVFTDFNMKRLTVSGVDSVVASFTFKDVPFEIFAQPTPTSHQTANRHFLVEERLLCLGGAAFHGKIQELRKQGLKTEPAFAAALGLGGDAYAELLSLQKLSESQLKERFSF
ncbi:VOC family protein [Bdellovibrio bacteriovorus]|uniref:VOC family protein n=1 Tax=Bdellovibrio bacteriovorus TaxID=959 RepID=UPI0021CF89AD|nr:VOC family protein [Bdellovibrio bacteriovorus]UXR65949.1 VOC family protein [Bdellovibrio bacteriovorus]